MKRMTAFFCAMLIVFLSVTVVARAEEPVQPFHAVNAAAAYCVNTEQILYLEHGDTQFAPGVVTKLLSLMVAYDLVRDCNRPLTTQVEIRSEWVRGSYVAGDRSSPYLGLSAGDTCSLEYLFATSLVANANDACAALVSYCAETLLSGTKADFLKKMNEKAQDLGLTDTSVADTVGFGGTGKTTVRDTVKLAAAFYRYNDLVKLSDCYSYGKIKNKNYLKCDYVVSGYLTKDAIGLIAGQATNDGNYCVVTACEKEGIAYVFAVIGAPGERIDEDGTHRFDDGNAYTDVRGMIPFVTEAYAFRTVCTDKDIVAEVRMGSGADQDFLRLVPAETVEQMVANPEDLPLEVHITYGERVYDGEFNGKPVKMVDAPVRQGDVLGSVRYALNGETLATVDLIAQESVSTNTLKTTFGGISDFLFKGPMGKIIRIVLAIIGLWLLICLIAMIVRIVRWFRDRKS